VQAGYRIAEQNCFRCHNMGGEGGEKSGRPWLVLAAWAAASPEYFSAYVRDPKKKSRHSEMPANRGYDDATIRAIRDYFATFIPVPAEKP
jgi:mono/diheme cytochrome c family protein